MTQHLAIIKGINVDGQHLFKGEDLQQVFETMGFENVSSYPKSGDVLFDAPASETGQFARRLRKQIQKASGHRVSVMVRTIPEIEEILQQDPFGEHEQKGSWQHFISFLHGSPDERKVQKLIALKSEAEIFGVANREVYALVDEKSDQKPLFSNEFVEEQLEIPAATRNRSIILEILSELK